MNDALIGYTGFVGMTLLKQKPFEYVYRSTNISEIRGHRFGLLVCAGAPAQKWIANRDPEADRQKITGLIEHLGATECGMFVLISTVDVFNNPTGITEDTVIDEVGLHPYGLHRRMLEKFVEGHFPKHLIARLPGLVGPGLRKNVIYDFLNSNNLHTIDSRGVFQYYPMVNLWSDIHTALRKGLRRVHLTAEPISVGEVALQGFGRSFEQCLANPPATYDLQSNYASLFGGREHYQYSKRETILAIRTYAQSEPLALTANGESSQ